MSDISGGGSTNTTTSNNSPPQEYLDAYKALMTEVNQVASTPYQAYQGNTVAGFSPDQIAGMQQVQELSANGGVQQPYLQAATRAYLNAQDPLLDNIPTISDPILQGQAYNGIMNLDHAANSGLGDIAGQGASGIQGAAGQGASGIRDASTYFNPDSISQFQNPYTQQVVDATQAQFNNQNAQQQQQVIGNAIGKGAWGGDRSAVAQAITAGQQQLAQAPVIAGLYSKGYDSASQAAQTAAAQRLQGATSAGSLGLQGATSAGSLGLQGATSDTAAKQAAAAAQLGLFSGQQQTELGANEANAWLSNQAGSGLAGLGQEALSTGLTNANALLSTGNAQQALAQQYLNVPYQQYVAEQAYPFQVTGWKANAVEGLGGSAGGTSSTTSPSASTASQVAGLATGAAGIAGSTGGFGYDGWVTNAFNGSMAAYKSGGGIGGKPHNMLEKNSLVRRALGGNLPSAEGVSVGGMTPRRAAGGDIPDVSLSVVPSGGLSPSPIFTPSSPYDVVPGASGMGTSPASQGTSNILKNYGTTSTTAPTSTDSTFGSLLQGAGIVAAYIYGGPQGGAAATKLSKNVTFAEGGEVPMRAAGGSDGWEPSTSRRMGRHGLLSSPVAGRTDKLAISPAAGSYVIPADVVSGLGEGNTLAGANIMQKILDTGPHGLKMPVASHNHMGPPRAPPAYNEETEHLSNTSRLVPNAAGGRIQRRSRGGYASLQDFINGVQRPTTILSGQNADTSSQPFQQQSALFPNAKGAQMPANTTAASAANTPMAGLGANYANRSYINASTGRVDPATGMGTSQTGLPSLDAYLNDTMRQGASYAKPPATPAPAPVAQPATTETDIAKMITDALAGKTGSSDGSGFGGSMRSGGMVPRRADGGGFDDEPFTDSTYLSLVPSRTPTAMANEEPTPAMGMKVEDQSVERPSEGMMQRVEESPGSGDLPTMADKVGDSSDSPRDKLRSSPSKADPWLALIQAGAAMMAGKSPNALTNIGAGAEAGMKNYMQQKQAAEKENLTADIASGKLGVQQQRADTAADVAAARIPLLEAQAAKFTREAAAGGKPETFVHKGDNDAGLPIFVGNRGTMKIGEMPIGLTKNQQSIENRADVQHQDRQAGLAQRVRALESTETHQRSADTLRRELGDNQNTRSLIHDATMLAAALGRAEIDSSIKQILAARKKVTSAVPSLVAPPTGTTSSTNSDLARALPP